MVAKALLCELPGCFGWLLGSFHCILDGCLLDQVNRV